ncbi:MAG: iron-sulfur cluster assembly scaffold protein [Patescibacteria group bacterium]|jgi:nitrogen fixation NifU-like protein
MYTKKTLSNFTNPKNYGKLKNPDGVGKVGNVVCGDVMWLYIKVEDSKISDIGFETFGCVAAIATSSQITELAKGKTLKYAMDIKKDDIVKSLGGLPPVKIHCSILAVDALAEAIYDYLKKQKQPISADLEKKHERIKQEKEIIECKYKDWTDNQTRVTSNQ